MAARTRLRRAFGEVGPALAFVLASLIVGLWFVALTEALSATKALAFGTLVGAWAAFAAVASGALYWLSRHPGGDYASGAKPTALLGPLPRSGTFWLLLGFTALVLGLVFLGAALSAPSNYDSMAYHLARQIFWMQERSVDFYPTNSIRQLFMPPFSEFVQLHHMILAGSDRWANLVQWFALLGTLVGTQHLAGAFGAGPVGRAFSALFVVTIPMAFMEGSSTKNDLVVSYFVVTTAVLGLRVVELGRASWALVICIGASLGLLLLTKGTAIVFALPVCAIVGIAMLLHGVGTAGGPSANLRSLRHWLTVLAAGAVLGITALAPNAGHFHRNLDMFGHLTGPKEPAVEGSKLYVNADMLSWKTITSNAIRSITLHLSLPSEAWNARVFGAAISLHERLGLDPNKEDTTWKEMPYKVVWFPKSEDRAGTMVHFTAALLVPLFVWIALARRRRPGVTADGVTADGVTADGVTADGVAADGVTAGGVTADGVTADGVTADGVTADGVTADRVTAGGVTAGGVTAGGVTAGGVTAGGVTAEGVAEEPSAGAPRWLLLTWTLVPAIGFVAFCAVFRWQPWHARLHVPLFALVAPLAGWLFDRPGGRAWFGRIHPGHVMVGLTAAACLAWLVPTLPHTGRPLWGAKSIWKTPRDTQRFNWRPSWERGSDLAVDVIRKLNPKQVGYKFGHNDIQYPLPRMVWDTHPHITWVNANPKPITLPGGFSPSDDAARLAAWQPTPEVIIATGAYRFELFQAKRRYLAVGHDSPYTVFVRGDLAHEAPSGGFERHRFFGWKSMQGLKKPRHGERVGRTNSPRLTFEHFRATRLRLVYSGNAGAPLTVRVNGSLTGTITLAPSLGTLDFDAKAGKNILELDGARGAIFTNLRVEPAR